MDDQTTKRPSGSFSLMHCFKAVSVVIGPAIIVGSITAVLFAMFFGWEAAHPHYRAKADPAFPPSVIEQVMFGLWFGFCCGAVMGAIAGIFVAIRREFQA